MTSLTPFSESGENMNPHTNIAADRVGRMHLNQEYCIRSVSNHLAEKKKSQSR